MNLNSTCCQLSFEVHYVFIAQKLRKLKISFLGLMIRLQRPLADKLSNLKFCQIALCVGYDVSYLRVVDFGLLVAPKLKKGRGAIMAPPSLNISQKAQVE